MESTSTESFYSLTPERILSAVEELGVRTTGRVLQLNSMENRVYEVEIEGEEKISRYEKFRVIKFYRPGRWTKQQILEEHGFFRELNANDIPVVAPLEFPKDGSTLGLLKDTEIWFAVFPKIGGRMLDELSDPQLEKLGRLVARLHIVGAGRTALHRLPLTPKSYGWDNLQFLLASKMMPPEVEPLYSRQIEMLLKYMEPLFQGIKTQRLHGDLHCGNVLWDRDQCFLVDLDDMVTGPAIQDLWLLVPGRDQDSHRRWEQLIAGYEQLRTFYYAEKQLIEPLRTLRIIHYSAWIARRFEDPTFQRAFPHFKSMEYWRGELAALQEQIDLLGG